MRKQGAKLAVFHHHKCGSTWMLDVLKELLSDKLLLLSVDSCGWVDSETAIVAATTEADLLFDYNGNRHGVKRLGRYSREFRGVHVKRDPRDILVSAYFSHRNSHPVEGWPGLFQHRMKLKSLSKEEGLHETLNFSWHIFEDLLDWVPHGDILELRYEDLIANATDSYCTLLDWFDLSFCRENLKAVLANHSFETKSGGRPLGESNPDSHYRTGAPGDWQNHLHGSLLNEVNDALGPIIEKFGYEFQS